MQGPLRPLLLGCQRRRSICLSLLVAVTWALPAPKIVMTWATRDQGSFTQPWLGAPAKPTEKVTLWCTSHFWLKTEFCSSLAVVLSGVFTSSHLLPCWFSHLHGVKHHGISRCPELGWAFHHSGLELHSSHQLVTGKFHPMLLSDAPHFLQACGMFLYSPGCKSLPSTDCYYIACIIRLRGSFETNQITGYCLILQLKLERIDHKNNCSGSRSGYK